MRQGPPWRAGAVSLSIIVYGWYLHGIRSNIIDALTTPAEKPPAFQPNLFLEPTLAIQPLTKKTAPFTVSPLSNIHNPPTAPRQNNVAAGHQSTHSMPITGSDQKCYSGMNGGRSASRRGKTSPRGSTKPAVLSPRVRCKMTP